MNDIKTIIADAIKDLFNEQVSVELTRPDPQFGDFSCNVALQLAKKMANPPAGGPREIAQSLAAKIVEDDKVASAEAAGPGFINITLRDQALWRLANEKPNKYLDGQTIVAEYSDPNPFKVLHAGHLYTSVVGDAIANLLENAGAKVHRVNFGGDVGLHAAKSMWAIIKELGEESPEKLEAVDESQRPDWLASRYIEGNEAYENDDTAKSEIILLNKKIYSLHAENDHDADFAKIYWTTRQWSYDYFDGFYASIGSHFDKYYPESETAQIGLDEVKSHIPDVFQESDGAVIFDGEKFGLHTRVFINSEGLPTYETKDVGLSILKKQDYDFDRSIIMTGNEQDQYMEVVLKAIEQFAPDLSRATTHISHGIVKLQGGVKMSSRKGNFLKAVDVLSSAKDANQQQNGSSDQQISLGAVKYAFLKHRIGGDIIYDPENSVSIHGNSGPYLQYAHARARSILEKSANEPSNPDSEEFDELERTLVQKLSEFSEVIERSSLDLAPHYICTYLYELSQTFNRFYEGSKVIGDDREKLRLGLVSRYGDVLQSGLKLLGIQAPNKV
ncbi:MAG: arginine--tRNA ligase [Patescibacteria group bacterium]